MTLYKNKYRSESACLPVWDYGSDGSYFVTICTKNRICWFGGVVDGQMVLSDMVLVAQREWEKTETMRQNVRLVVGTHCNASLPPPRHQRHPHHQRHP